MTEVPHDVEAVQEQSEPSTVAVTTETPTNNLKRSAPADVEDQAPEAKQARLENVGEYPGPSASLDELLPQVVEAPSVQAAAVPPDGGAEVVTTAEQPAAAPPAVMTAEAVQAAATEPITAPVGDSTAGTGASDAGAVVQSPPVAASVGPTSEMVAQAAPAVPEAVAPAALAADQQAAGDQQAAATQHVAEDQQTAGAQQALAAPQTASAHQQPSVVPTAAIAQQGADVQQAPTAQQTAGDQQVPEVKVADVKPEDAALPVKAESPAGRGNREYSRDKFRGSAYDGAEAGGNSGSFRMPADAILKQEIPLPRRMASCVIGIKGQTVSKLRRDTGAKIHIRPGQGPSELDQVVEIEGSIESVVTCIRSIDELVRAEDANYKMVPKTEVMSKFYVLPEMIGPAIIGKAGTHAKHIRERTGVRIEVVPPAENPTRQHIVLHGTAERVREAYHLLLSNIRKYGPSLPAGSVPQPLPFPNRPPTSAERGAGGRKGAGRGRGSAPPPPPPRGGAAAGATRYDAYGAAPTHAYAPPAPGPAVYPAPVAAPPAYVAPVASYMTSAADPSAAATVTAATSGQQMYILQDGVLKPLSVMYQQPAASAVAPVAANQLVQSYPGYTTASAAAPAAYATAAPVASSAGPLSTGGAASTLATQQPAATYSYATQVAVEAAPPAMSAAPLTATSTWMGALQQLPGAANSQSGAVPAHTYLAYAQPAAPGAPGGVQYVQHSYQQQ